MHDLSFFIFLAGADYLKYHNHNPYFFGCATLFAYVKPAQTPAVLSTTVSSIVCCF